MKRASTVPAEPCFPPTHPVPFFLSSTFKKRKHVPNHQRWYAKWKLSRNMYTCALCTFCTFGADLYAQSVITKKISELSRKFIKSALLVGYKRVTKLRQVNEQVLLAYIVGLFAVVARWAQLLPLLRPFFSATEELFFPVPPASGDTL